MNKVFYTFVTLFLNLFFLATTTYANEYKVKPYLIVPSDWNTPETQKNIPIYKQNIIGTLERSQAWFARILGGKTFDFDRDVTVLLKETSLNRSLGTTDISDLAPAPGRNTTNIGWYVGIWNGTAAGFGSPNEASLSFDMLLDLGTEYSDLSDKVTTHELGHAFGLVYGGWARGHPCTEASKNECEENAPKPLPSIDEWNKSIMGQGSFNLRGRSLNNSVHNPEIWKIYKSPFINPQNDRPPEPIGTVTPPAFIIDNIQPQPVEVGQVLEIQGRGFDDTPHTVYVVINDRVPWTEIEKENILTWSDTLVRIKIDKPAIKLCLVGVEAKIKCFSVQTKGPLPAPILRVKVSATCAQDKKPMAGVNIVLEKEKANSGNYGIVTNDAGRGSIVFPIFQQKQENEWALTPGEYALSAPKLNNITPNPQSHIIKITNTDTETSREELINFHYPICLDDAILFVKPLLTCGINNKPLEGISLELFKSSFENKSLGKATTGKDGTATWGIKIKDYGRGTYGVILPVLDGILPIPKDATIGIYNIYEPMDWSPNFRYPQCPNKLLCPDNLTYCNQETNKKIYKHAGTWNDEKNICDYAFESLGSCSCPEVYSQCGGTAGLENEKSSDTFRVIPVCNNEGSIVDYKEENLGATEKCLAIVSTPLPSQLPSPSPIQNIQGAPAPIQQLANLFPQIVKDEEPLKKEVVSIKVDGNPVVLDGSSGIDISLPGTVGISEVFEVPIVIEYSDGSIKAFKLKFNYNPQQGQNQEREIIDWCSKKECDTNLGKLVCYKKYSDGTEEISEATDELCVEPTPQQPIQPSTPGQQPGSSTGSASLCPAPYGQCGGTAGLESYPTSHTVQVSPVCSIGANIIRYDHHDLGNKGECCEDKYYFDSGVDSCIHKHSPNDAVPNCAYVFDHVDRGFCGL